MSTKKIKYLNGYVSQKINHYIEESTLANNLFYKVIDNYDDVTFIDIMFSVQDGCNLYYVRDDNHLCCAQSYNNIVTEYKVLDIENCQTGIGKRHIKYTQFMGEIYRIQYFEIDGHEFEIWLFMNKNQNINKIFDEIIDEILNENRNISSIRDIVYAIGNVISLEKVNLDIKDLNNNGKISFYGGNLEHFEEYSLIGNCLRKTYLENGKFYVQEVYTKELEKDRIPFVKSIGGKRE